MVSVQACCHALAAYLLHASCQQLTHANATSRPQGWLPLVISGVQRVAVTVEMLAHLLGPHTPVRISTAECNSLKQVGITCSITMPLYKYVSLLLSTLCCPLLMPSEARCHVVD
jgi:hypothetical protein